MYTEYEKYMAIKYILTLYTEHKEEELRNYKYLSTHKNKKDANRHLISALDIQKVQGELFYVLTIIKGMDDIIKRFKPEEKKRVAAELDIYCKKMSCTPIIEAMAYYFDIEKRFPREIELFADPEEMKNEISKIFACKEMIREWQVVYSILLETLPSLPGFEKAIQSRQLVKKGR